MKKLFIALLTLLLGLPVAQAQERRTSTQAELDQMLAPIALYPDALLSQVLMAATYPLDVVQAARWAREHPGLQGDEAVRAAQDREWDPSVKSLLAFPKLLARMDEQLEWTKRLGDAFLEQEPHVMETVQQLRRRAHAAGQLTPDERVRIADDAGSIVIEPANPQVVYVPYYDPWVVYGPWWWSAYPPVAWAPWPGYTAYRPGIWWGVGVGVSTGFFFGGVDWHYRHVKVVHLHNHYVRPPALRAQTQVQQRPLHVGKWQHDGWHQRGLERRTAERRGEYRAQPMPPAFRASNPQPRAQVQPTTQAQPTMQAQPRIGARQEQPRIGTQQEQPRIGAQQEQPRIGAQQAPPRTEPQPQLRGESQPRMRGESQPRMRGESQPRMRGDTRGGGNGGGRSGGWREHAGRGNGRS